MRYVCKHSLYAPIGILCLGVYLSGCASDSDYTRAINKPEIHTNITQGVNNNDSDVRSNIHTQSNSSTSISSSISNRYYAQITTQDWEQPRTRSQISSGDWDILFRTVYGECRNQVDAEIEGIVNVIYNRWASRKHGQNLSDVLMESDRRGVHAFSVWNKGDPSRRIITRDSKIDPDKMLRVEQISRKTIERRLANEPKADRTMGALYFYHPASMDRVRIPVDHRHHRGSKHQRYRYVPRTPQWAQRGVYSHKLKIGQAIFVVPQQ